MSVLNHKSFVQNVPEKKAEALTTYFGKKLGKISEQIRKTPDQKLVLQKKFQKTQNDLQKTIKFKK